MPEKKKKKGIKRRDFIKGAAAGAGVAALAGLGIKEVKAAPPPKMWDDEADIVIVGAGGAGMMAAIQAHDAGAKVLVLEKVSSVYSSSTSISGGGFSAAGTKAQKEQGINDSPSLFYKDMMKSGGYMNNPELVKALTENAATVFDWLFDHGLPLLHVEPFGGHGVIRFHRTKRYSGKDYVDTSWKIFQQKKIPIEFKVPVKRLYYDISNQRVLGVEAKKGGNKIAIKAQRAVIVATGGFTGDVKTFDRWIPAFSGVGVLIGGSGNAGDGIKMATKDAGGFPTHTQFSATYPMGVEVGHRVGPICRYYYFYPRGAIIVNKDGKRYINEETSPTKITPELAKQPEKVHFLIADNVTWEEAFSKYPPDVLFGLPGWSMKRIQEEIRKERVLMKADTIRELSKKAGIEPDNLENTVTNYNTYVKKGEDPVFKRSKKTLTREIKKPPFYAVKMTFWTCLTLGGMRVNSKWQVLDPYDTVIKGLYGAGETVGGVHGSSYLSGCALAWAYTSGYMAGRNAAAEKPWG